MEIFGSLVDFVFAQSCLGCGRADRVLCANCLSAVPKASLRCLKCGARNPFGRTCVVCKTRYTPDLVLAANLFEGVLREAIHLFKYDLIFISAFKNTNFLNSVPLKKSMARKGKSFAQYSTRLQE